MKIVKARVTKIVHVEFLKNDLGQSAELVKLLSVATCASKAELGFVSILMDGFV